MSFSTKILPTIRYWNVKQKGLRTKRKMLTTQTNVIIFFLTIEISNCMEPFIIGGNFTKIFRFPHSAFLMVYADMGSSIWICGSSILNQRILLTAAHCLFPCDVEAQVDVLAGDENLLMVRIRKVPYTAYSTASR